MRGPLSRLSLLVATALVVCGLLVAACGGGSSGGSNSTSPGTGGAAPKKATAALRSVCQRVNFNAASIASAPLLVKNTFFGDAPGAAAASRPASSICGA